MGLFKRLFSRQAQEAPSESSQVEKDKVPVYPMIKSGEWKGMSRVEHIPFVTLNGHLDLAVVFAQDAGDQFMYITEGDLQNPAVKANFDQWQANIDNYPFEIEISERLNKRVIFASGEDHSSEKILSKQFLEQACKTLNTDKLIISIPRRRCLMITSYYEEFSLLESFFHLHFIAWREEDYGNEVITEMVFVADKDKVQYAVPLGFRLNLYEKDGRKVLSYSTMDELFDENNQIDFQKLIERNKVPVTL